MKTITNEQLVMTTGGQMQIEGTPLPPPLPPDWFRYPQLVNAGLAADGPPLPPDWYRYPALANAVANQPRKKRANRR